MLKIYAGPMDSNKTGTLLHHVGVLRTHGKKDVLVIKPDIDTKAPKGKVRSRNNGGTEASAFEIDANTPERIFDLLRSESRRIGSRVCHVAIDEAQFFTGLYGVVHTLLTEGCNVFVAGLDKDFRGEPFGDMGNLMLLVPIFGGDVHWCVAYCTKCGAEAAYSQRMLPNDIPAPYDSPLIFPGDSYEPRCREHFVLPRPDAEAKTTT